jgi:hypothetical protein
MTAAASGRRGRRRRAGKQEDGQSRCHDSDRAGDGRKKGTHDNHLKGTLPLHGKVLSVRRVFE